MIANPGSSYTRLPGCLLVILCLSLVQACSQSVTHPVYLPSPSAPPPPRYEHASPASQAPQTVARAEAKSVRVVEKCLIDGAQCKTITHEVGPLETVWRISRMYDVPVRDICTANRMKAGDALRIGQKLLIPNARTLRHVIPLYPGDQWKYIIIHHTATDIGNAILVNRSHHDRGFWHGLGYHFIIDNGTLGKGDGQIEVSPRWIKQQEGAHCKAGGMNEKAIGLALVGNFNETLPTKRQMESLAYLLRTLMQQYRIAPSKVQGHRDVDGASTDCPGKRFPWSNLRQCLSVY